MATTKTKAKVKKKYNPEKKPYVSSPLFKMNERQHSAINSSIRESFEFMKCGNFGQRQWTDMLTRMIVGKLMIARHYTDDTAKQFEPCVNRLRDIELRAASTDHEKWDMTSEEQETLEAGLDAVEQIQKEVTRMEFLNAHREADIIITKMYVHKLSSKEAGLVPVA